MKIIIILIIIKAMAKFKQIMILNYSSTRFYINY